VITTAHHSSPPPGGPEAAGVTLALALVWLASAAVIGACLLASFRLDLGEDVGTVLRVNGPRVLFGAGVGLALALSGALRLAAGSERPLRELEILAVASGGAGGGFLLAGARSGIAALLLFPLGALTGAMLLVALVRQLDRPKRWTNLPVAGAIAGMAALAAVVGTYARARRDLMAPAVSWLLGDLNGASMASGLAMLALATGLMLAALRGAGNASDSRAHLLALASFGLGVGAAGPLAFVGTLAPRTVRWLARGATQRALLSASAVAGAATVVAVDAVPRLLVGGYDFPWNVPAAMLAIPLFAGWNRARLRRQVGAASLRFEITEVAFLAGLTLGGIWLASVLTLTVRAVT
jgi:ABC-type Fe3+-siderophore transport system permease subunit